MALNKTRSVRKKKTQLPRIGRRVVKSQYEFDLYKSLLGIVNGGMVEYETEKLEYTETKQYIPDLIVTQRDGTKMYIEGKGFFPYSDRAKMLAVKAEHPELDIRIVFYRNSPSSLGKGSKTSPGEWADKYGFPWALKEIPTSWFAKEE